MEYPKESAQSLQDWLKDHYRISLLNQQPIPQGKKLHCRWCNLPFLYSWSTERQGSVHCTGDPRSGLREISVPFRMWLAAGYLHHPEEAEGICISRHSEGGKTRSWAVLQPRRGFGQSGRMSRCRSLLLWSRPAGCDRLHYAWQAGNPSGLSSRCTMSGRMKRSFWSEYSPSVRFWR